jgi:mono/diheme cytochrome c family protein
VWENSGGTGAIHSSRGLADSIVQPGQPKSKIRPLGIVALLVVLGAGLLAAIHAGRNWSAAAAAKRLKNPISPTSDAIAAGRQIYGEHCRSCHGEKGDGRGEKAAELSVAPGDFTDASAMRRRTDGELFWQITRGRLPMPAFDDKLSDEQRWQVVDYIRTFAQRPSGSTSALSLTALWRAPRKLRSCPAPSGCRSS